MERKYGENLNLALHELLATDKSVLVIGEDVADPYGGAFKVTRGLSTKYPEQVISTPISEAGIVGLAGGLALRGFRPIVEIMFGDFLLLCADQIINHLAKYRQMYKGKVRCPVVIRTPMGGGRGYGPTHSQSLEKHFLGVPDLDVVAPSHFAEPGELLKQIVINSENPVLFIEHKILYSTALHLKDHGQLRVEQVIVDGYPVSVISNFASGAPDAVLVTYGGNSILADKVLNELAEEEIGVVCLLPALISRPPVGLIAEYVFQAGGRAVFLEEATAGFGWSAEVIAAMRAGKAGLKIARVAATSGIIPAGRSLEEKALPSVIGVKTAILEVLE